jgi:hypothetical protein
MTIFVLNVTVVALLAALMITSSPISGKIPPSQMAEFDQLPVALTTRRAMELILAKVLNWGCNLKK